jgi:hypothetical protein
MAALAYGTQLITLRRPKACVWIVCANRADALKNPGLPLPRTHEIGVASLSWTKRTDQFKKDGRPAIKGAITGGKNRCSMRAFQGAKIVICRCKA